MIVQCRHNQVSDVDPESAVFQELRESVKNDTDALDLTVGNLYVVYALVVRRGFPWYFIADDLYGRLSYPLAYAANFFDIIDNRVSRCWTIGFRQSGRRRENISELLITFKEWVDDAMFFERLIDGNDREIAIFRRYKAFMDLEYPAPWVDAKAELLQDSWVMCPECNEAWESGMSTGMTRCPKCSKVLLNPLYLPPESPCM